MKEKQNKQTSIKDLLNEYQTTNPVDTQNANRQSNIASDTMYTSEFNSKIEEYNSKVTDLDPVYSSVVPLQDILVRVFLVPTEKDENGLIVPIIKPLQIPTKNNMATWGYLENPFPYSTKAVVVSVPTDYTLLKPGDIVQLSSDNIEAKVVGASNDAQVEIKNGYMHPDAENKAHSKDPLDVHYGYLLIPSYQIKAKL